MAAIGAAEYYMKRKVLCEDSAMSLTKSREGSDESTRGKQRGLKECSVDKQVLHSNTEIFALISEYCGGKRLLK